VTRKRWREEDCATADARSASNVAYCDASDNRRAGSFIANRLRPYCDHQRVSQQPGGNP
jgi:hypothetical protein